jgi:hypothetical protein
VREAFAGLLPMPHAGIKGSGERQKLRCAPVTLQPFAAGGQGTLGMAEFLECANPGEPRPHAKG